MEDYQAPALKKLSDFKQYVQTKTRNTERGDLLVYFVQKINAERDGKKYKKVKIPYVAGKLTGFELRDLYYIKSICDDAHNRGYSWSKCFFGSLKIKIEALNKN